MKKQVGTERASHIVALVSGVKATDTRTQAALKVVETMRRASFPAADIRKAERLAAQIKIQEER